MTMKTSTFKIDPTVCQMKLSSPPMTRGEAFRKLGVSYINRAQYSAQADDGREVISLWVENLDISGSHGKAYINQAAMDRVREGQIVKAVIMEKFHRYRQDGLIIKAVYPDDCLWKVDSMHGTELLVSRIKNDQGED